MEEDRFETEKRLSMLEQKASRMCDRISDQHPKCAEKV